METPVLFLSDFLAVLGWNPGYLSVLALHPGTPQTPREDGCAGHPKEESDLELVPGGTNS